MKSAYELAMERLNKESPQARLTDAQRRELAELDSVCAAKIAEREIEFQGRIAGAEAAGDFEAAAQAREQLSIERRKLQADLEEKKESVRSRRRK
jgi:hypothetical protein